jgi:hypothetical protein
MNTTYIIIRMLNSIIRNTSFNIKWDYPAVSGFEKYFLNMFLLNYNMYVIKI